MTDAERPKTVLFVCFAKGHSTCRRKVDQLRKSGVAVAVYDSKLDKNKTGLAQRLLSFAYGRLFLALLFSTEEVLWLWGGDVCFVGALVGFLRRDKKIVWDIPDLHPALLSRSKASRALRCIERLLLKRVDRLILTSQGFYDFYYRNRVEMNRVSVIENLMEGQPPSKPAPERRRAGQGAEFNVIYPGILRTNAILQLIADTADRGGNKFRFHLWGYFDRNIEEDTVRRLLECRNVEFHGEYDERDLPRIYEGMQLTFGLVDVDSNKNEKWLLHNRLYQAGAFGCPLISTSGSFVGKETLRRGLGWVVRNDSVDLFDLLKELSEDRHCKYTELTAKMPEPRDFYFDNEYEVFLSKV
jgi:glycosyltransferase involved in cell wall biosynthesis